MEIDIHDTDEYYFSDDFLHKRFLEIKKLPSYYKCVKCNGTGLSNVIKIGDETWSDFSWDGHSLCRICKGFGIFDWVENLTCDIETIFVENEVT